MQSPKGGRAGGQTGRQADRQAEMKDHKKAEILKTLPKATVHNR